MHDLSVKLENIRRIKDFRYLLDEKQDQRKIIKYYNVNRLPYRLFHNKSGYLHMGISPSGLYRQSDLLGQLEYIEKIISDSQAANILELGYGRGANINYLAKRFPSSNFTGIDISTAPLKKYACNKNASFIRGDFHDLEKIGRRFDIVYAIESLCHSDNLSKLLKSASAIMERNALLIIFDGYYLKDKSILSREETLACSLTEKGMAVNEFHSLQKFKEEARMMGLIQEEEADLSQNILPSLYRFEKLASRFFRHKSAAKALSSLLPEIFVRNVISGYLMPDLINLGIAGYFRQVFRKE